MACSTNLQDRAIKKIQTKRKYLTSSNDVLSTIKLIPGLESYTLDKAIEEFSGDNLIFLRSVLDSMGYTYTGTLKKGLTQVKSRKITNIDSIFSSYIIDDLFDTLHVAKQYFKLESERMLTEATIINYGDDKHYTQNNLELNNNIKTLKNRLFETIVRFLKTNGVNMDYEKYFKDDQFIAKLYNIKGEPQNYTLYKSVLKELEKFLLGPNNENGITSLSGHMIPTIRGNIRKLVDREKFDAYNAAVLLSNFDLVVSKYFGNILVVDYSAHLQFDDPVKNFKYSLKTKGKTNEYFLNDTHAEEGAQTNLDQLSERIINSIRHYDKNGEETGMYLDSLDFYSLASLIREFERTNWKVIIERKSKEDNTYGEFYKEWSPLEENPAKMLNLYLDKILDVFKDGIDPDPKSDDAPFLVFKHKLDIIQSLKKFIEPLTEKEKNSKISIVGMLTQVLTNSYGANYAIYNAVTGTMTLKEMHSHNALAIDTQNSIYSHLLDTYSDLDRYNSGLSEEELKNLNDPTVIEKEKKYITDHTDSDFKLSYFIKHTLGIFVGTHGAAELRKKWGNKLASNLRDILVGIRSEKDNSTLHDKILKNETLIANQEYSLVESYSSVISDLVQDSSVRDIIDTYLDNFILRPIMNITTLSGEQIPTYKLANLMYSDTALLLDRYKFEQENKEDIFYKQNIFTDLKSEGILGTSTGLEIINSNKNKKAVKFNVAENFTAFFKFGFLDSFRPGSEAKGVHVLIGNYADKSTIMAKIISKGITHNNKLIIGKSIDNTTGTEIMSMDEVLDLFRNQTLKYYSDLLVDTFKQYQKLSPDLAKKIKIPESFTSIEIFENNIKAINEFLSDFKKVDDFLNFVTSKVKEDSSIRMTEELHYSFYNNKKVIALNQTCVNYFRIFGSDKLFNEFVRREESSFIEKLNKVKGEYLFTSDELDNLDQSFYPNSDAKSKDAIRSLLKSFGIKREDYEVFSKEDGDKISITPKDKSKGHRLNPLLRRWMWTSNLFRNEFLNLSIKAEYMHPHKDEEILYDINVVNDKYSEDQLNEFFTNFRYESSKRIPNMSKRNGSFTATYENGLKNSRKGEPSNLNVAVIKDFIDQTFNMSGKTHKQDVHDGSSMIPYVYAKMIEESYPGKGYTGTKKRIATFVTDYGSALKKDAESVITNDAIRISSKSIINLKNIQKKALGTIPLPKIKNVFRANLPTSGIYYKYGQYRKISEYSLSDGILTLTESVYDPNLQKFGKYEKSSPIEVKNLYDIWNAFGAETTVDFGVDGAVKFSEGSNDLLYDLITTATDEKGEYVLKNAMIHIISNASAFKSGATNVNTKEAWVDLLDGKLAYTTYKGRFIGPQLDASHEANASKIKEITQIVSALSQNTRTASFAEEVYNSLAKIIEISAEPYIKKITNISPELKMKYYKELSLSFANSLARSDGESLAKTIAEVFGRGNLLPFSNQTFFKEFSRDLITKMNNEFIVRYYNGLPMVLNPSHKMIQIFEDKDGNVYSQSDLMLEAFKSYVPTAEVKTNDQIFDEYLNKRFPPEQITIDKVLPGYNYARRKDLDINEITKSVLDSNIELKDQLKEAISILNPNIVPSDIVIERVFDQFIIWLYKDFNNIPETGIDISKMVDYLTEIKDELIDAESYFNNIYSKYEDIVINSIEDYYEFKANYSGEPIYKMYNRSRDLNPSQMQYEIETSQGTITQNIFDSEPVRLRYALEKLFSGKEINKSDNLTNPESANGIYEILGFGKENNNIEILTSNYTRQSVQNDVNSLYLFTDNAERTSRPTASEENVDKTSWYYKKYKSKTDKPIHFGSTSNPTSAVIRGLNNAYPISTMSAYGTNWTNNNFELFKQTIDDEIAQIKKDLSKFTKLKIGNFRIGQGGRFAKLPQQHQQYLDNKLLEIGIDNTGDKPKIINSQTIPQQKQGVSELFESNPELANAVYSAIGLTTINESEITWTDEEGNPCAKMGGRSSKFTKGSKWEIVKDLKGYPTHAQGGIDIKLGKNGFSFTRNNGVIEAKHGLVLPKIK